MEKIKNLFKKLYRECAACFCCCNVPEEEELKEFKKLSENSSERRIDPLEEYLKNFELQQSKEILFGEKEDPSLLLKILGSQKGVIRYEKWSYNKSKTEPVLSRLIDTIEIERNYPRSGSEELTSISFMSAAIYNTHLRQSNSKKVDFVKKDQKLDIENSEIFIKHTKTIKDTHCPFKKIEILYVKIKGEKMPWKVEYFLKNPSSCGKVNDKIEEKAKGDFKHVLFSKREGFYSYQALLEAIKKEEGKEQKNSSGSHVERYAKKEKKEGKTVIEI